MKLKKIASLMLAGIMAVSMLAGCKDAASSSKPTEEPEVPAAGVSAEFASYLTDNSRVAFKDDATYQGYLSKWLDKEDFKHTVLSAVDDVTPVANATNIADILKDNVNGYTDAKGIHELDAITADTDMVVASVYEAPGSMNKSVVLKAVADALNTKLADSLMVDYYVPTRATYRYDYEYTASVSMQKVEDGSSSAWYVLVTLNIDATKVDQK